MRNASKQQGFTLIELIVVIVILGILAVTAAPKFISFTGDANKSTLQGLKAGLSGGMALTYSKAAIAGVETVAASTSANVATVYGYPAGTAASILATVDISAATDKSADWVYNITTGTVVLAPVGKVDTVSSPATATEVKAGNCYVSYVQATSAAAADIATVTVTESGC